MQVTIIVFELSARDISSRDRKLYSRAVDTTALMAEGITATSMVMLR